MISHLNGSSTSGHSAATPGHPAASLSDVIRRGDEDVDECLSLIFGEALLVLGPIVHVSTTEIGEGGSDRSLNRVRVVDVARQLHQYLEREGKYYYYGRNF